MKTEVCPECEGTGKALETCCGDTITGEVEDYGVCPTCGEHIDIECDECSGAGKVPDHSDVKERFNFYQCGGDNGPTGHGEDCLSDADAGL